MARFQYRPYDPGKNVSLKLKHVTVHWNLRFLVGVYAELIYAEMRITLTYKGSWVNN